MKTPKVYAIRVALFICHVVVFLVSPRFQGRRSLKSRAKKEAHDLSIGGSR